MSLEENLVQQQESALLITKFLANLKKAAKEKRTYFLYESRLSLLERYWSKFADRHEQLIVLTGYAATDYAKNNLFEVVEEAYVDAQAYVRQRMEELKPTKLTPAVSSGNPVPAKLHELNLPTFSGNYLEWESFKDLFVSSVHNNPNLSNATRLQYLKAQLAGEAANLLRNVQITEANYLGAWKALTDRYDNARVLANHYLESLLSTKPSSVESAQQLRNLLDTTASTRRALENLKRPVEHWDDWFVHLTVRRLHITIRKEWETSVGDKKTMPTWDELAAFLSTKSLTQAVTEPLEGPLKVSRIHPAQETRRTFRSNAAKITKDNPLKTCPLCNEHHYIAYCRLFKQKTPQQRREEVSRLQLCLNCLKLHGSSQCPSVHRCSICHQPHHTSLHQETSSTGPQPHPPVLTAHSTTLAPNVTLLATAVVRVHGSNGRSAVVRALLDQGSEATFMSEDLAQYLRLPRSKVTVPVIGMGASSCGTAKSMVQVQLTPVLEGYHGDLRATAYVLPNLMKTFQPRRIDPSRWNHLRHLLFSDSQPQTPSNIEFVIGADLYGYALLEGLVRGPPGTPVAQQTVFGWVLSGTISEAQPSEFQLHNLHCSVDLTLSSDLRRFWEIEEIPAKTLLSPEEEFCEQHYQKTHSRDAAGKFIVRLPRRLDVPLGDSYTSALRSFRRAELQRQRNPALSLAYQNFMEEYVRLGHMKPISEKVRPTETFYLPHHAVWKQEGENAKIRVVFNASAATTSGHSLNDLLLPGPKLQQDLGHILLRWRKYLVVFSADIVKMFRQIWVHPEDQPLQRILWRSSPAEELQEFQLQTVTYGTSCAPFLAIRTLLQLASESAQRFPNASASLRHQAYVDDILTGADTLEEALDLKRQLEGLLTAGGFELAKWASNSRQLAPPSSGTHILSDGTVKTLGIHWNPAQDTFGFQVELANQTNKTSKRIVLSCIARLFDPLGWLAPVLVKAKIFLQDLWSVKTDWDAGLPPPLEESWIQYYRSLQDLQEIQIPRWIHTQTESSCELHGFCDASQRAYAACVYLRTRTANGRFQTNLLIAKTKVAPLKVISLPRLELSGAVLLVRLLQNVVEALQLPSPAGIHAWTDSQVALHWISGVPARWKPFVANRVSEVHQTLPHATWHHISSSENPADPASRGIPSATLKNNALWWHGPSWLSQEEQTWPTSTVAVTSCSPEALQEENPKLRAFCVVKEEPWNLLERYSSLTRLLRVTCWLRRFADNTRTPAINRRLEPLTTLELSRARQFWIKCVQESHFVEELRLLQGQRAVPKRSPLHRLRPFRDSSHLLRVGGRLENAPVGFEEKHPIILPAKSTFSKLLVTDFHRRTLHGGPHLTLGHLSSQYWIIGGRNLVKKVIRDCVVCCRYAKTVPGSPLMGQLPASRVTPARPFSHAGLDYAGPIMMRPTKGRGRISTKGYIALFVCMATKAIHLEAVSDCSTAAFIAAFKRFVSRRGIPVTLYSDQATNFRGAEAELTELFTRASSQCREIADLLANDGTQWRFIPPHSPHFGGLWEAGVKSVKGHLRRVIGDTRLTFEELSTILAEIEACLNSRPITPLRSSPQDLAHLTPGHFLIGSAPKTIPEPSLSETPLNRLSRWQLLRRLTENFWRRWSKEYLHHLNQRQKWTTDLTPMRTGDMVLIQEDNLPPSKWRLGRVVEVHPGADEVVRVVTVRTATSTYRRPVAKLRRLPIA